MGTLQDGYITLGGGGGGACQTWIIYLVGKMSSRSKPAFFQAPGRLSEILEKQYLQGVARAKL